MNPREPDLLPPEAWNATARAYPQGACLHHLFEAQARRTPAAIAVVDGERCVTYAELNARGNQLAHHLRELGVGPDVRVGLCLHRSAELMIGLLATLKAGGCYVPLDPEYPVERLRELLHDSTPRVVLVDDAGEQVIARADDERRCARLHLTADADRWAHAPAHDAAPAELSDRNLAYVIYTSGSTGRPKGVMNEHRGVINGLRWCQETFALTERDVMLQKTPFSFDVSVWEFFPPLMVGARLVMAKPGGHRDPSYLCDVIRRAGVTTLHFVPSMLQLFLDHDEVRQCASIARLICAGEALPASLARAFHARLPWAELHNLYGPTEAAVMVTAFACAAGDPRPAIPIGRPIANTRIYLLDEGMRPAPVGVAGELYIGGAQVARGYLNRPELTAERFVDDPFVAGGRLYKTGDLGRWLADGTVEFLGRNDFQVKIRGFRIELGEIEAKLSQLDGVREAVVLAREGADGNQRLVAYYTGERAPGAEVLRRHAVERLPEYMVPAAYVKLAALPLSPNGKLDRRALPAPPRGAHVRRAYEAPRGEVEQALARIWGELLQIEQVGRDDDFFELGGHSLLAVRAVSRIRAALVVDLPLRGLFDATTVALLAREVARSPKLDGDGGALPRVPRDGPLLPSPVQEGMWFLEQLHPGVYSELFAIHLSGPLDTDRLRRCLGAIANRHEALRSVFVARDGMPIVRLLDSIGEPLAMAPEADEAGLAEVARREASRPFDLLRRGDGDLLRRGDGDLERGPLVRFVCVPLGPERHALLCHIHHLITDGISQAVLLSELAERYAADASRREPRLAPLAAQYVDYAAWHRARLSEARRGELLDHWRHALAGLPPALELPIDGPRPPVPSYRGARHAFTIPAPLADELRRLGPHHGATPFMMLLGLFQVLLGRYAGRRDVVVGIPVSTRDRDELEPLVGLFVNTVPVRIQLEPDTTVRELLQRSRRAVTDALAHRDLPFPDLVAGLAPARDPSRHPIVQVLFGLDVALPPVRAADLDLTAEDLDGGIARFDLSMLLREQEGGGLAGVLEYAIDLWSPAGAQQIARHYLALVAEACRRPEAAVSRLEIMDTGDTGGHEALSRALARRPGELEPAPAPAPAIVDRAAGAALSPSERQIAAVWGELLGVAIHDPEADFFELGGTSLLLMRATSRLNRETGRALSVLALFQARTVRRVAELLAAAPEASEPESARALELPPLSPRRDATSWPLTSSQRISWELTHRGRQSVFEWPRRVFELQGPLDRVALRRAADAVAMRHPVLRARFARTGGELVQTVDPAPHHDWHELDVPPGPDGDARAPVQRELGELLERPFDLTAGPVLRFVLARTSADHHWFGFAAHHIALDGGSFAPFLGDLAGAYRQLATGREVAWSAPALALADVAAWEQAVWRTAGPAMAAYWREQLAGARPPPLPLAGESGEPDLEPARVITCSFTLTGAAVDRLRRTAAAIGSTPFIVALTSLGATVRALTGSEDVCIASPYGRRDLEAASGVVGYMAHPLLLRLDGPRDDPGESLTRDASFARSVAHTGERVLGAYRHGQVPLVFGSDVLPGLPSCRALGGESLYRIFFNYLDLARASLDLGPSLRAAPVDLGPESETRFPLMLFAVETQQALIWNVVAQARWYRPEQVASLAERIGLDLERALAAAASDPLESPGEGA